MTRGIQNESRTVSTDHASAPTLILHAKDDALVSYHHAEHAHEAIQGSGLMLLETGGDGLLYQMDAVRQDVKGFAGAIKPK